MELNVNPWIRFLILFITGSFFILDGILPFIHYAKVHSIDKIYDMVRFFLRIIIGITFIFMAFVRYLQWPLRIEQNGIMILGSIILIMAIGEFIYWLSRKRIEH